MARKKRIKVALPAPAQSAKPKGGLPLLRLLVATVLIIGAPIVFIIELNDPDEVAAVVRGSEAVGLTYSGGQTQAVSPFCGCLHNQGAFWKGISIPRGRFEVRSSGGEQAAAYSFVAPFPGPFSAPSDAEFILRAFNASEQIIKLGGDGDAIRDLPQSSVKGATYKDNTKYRRITLITKEPIFIEPIYYPSALFVPVANNETRVSKTHPAFVREEEHVIVQQRYSPVPIDFVRRSNEQSADSRPMLDFVSRVAVWTYDRDAQIVDDQGEHFHAIDPDKPNGFGAMFVFHSALSIRMQVGVELPPTTESSQGPTLTIVATAHHTDEEKRAFWKRHVDEEGELVFGKETENPDGWFAYDVRRRKELRLPVTPYRYPPTTALQFGFYGVPSALEFTSALGAVTVGTRSVELNAPSSIRVDMIDAFRIKGAFAHFPFDGTESDVQFQSLGVLSVNNRRVRHAFGNWVEIVAFIGGISGILALAPTIWPLIRLRR